MPSSGASEAAGPSIFPIAGTFTRLLDRGLTQRQTVFLLYMVSALLGLGALALAGVNRTGSIATLGVIAVILLIGARRMGLLTR